VSAAATAVLAIIAVWSYAQMDSVAFAGGPKVNSVVDAGGNLHVPDDYRTAYEFLGAWSIAAEKQGSKEIQLVYASLGAAADYRANGRFPDQMVLVKEVFQAATGEMTTGIVSRA
jgi:hypothetical protein